MEPRAVLVPTMNGVNAGSFEWPDILVRLLKRFGDYYLPER
jgi:hypothetical protein